MVITLLGGGSRFLNIRSLFTALICSSLLQLEVELRLSLLPPEPLPLIMFLFMTNVLLILYEY